MFNLHTVAPLLLWLACCGMAEAGEIVISPEAKGKIAPAAGNSTHQKTTDTTSLRNKARAYQSGAAQSMPASGIPAAIQVNSDDDSDDGVMLPRTNEIPTSVNGIQGLIRDNMPNAQDMQPNENEDNADINQGLQLQLEQNRSKARQYMQGKPAPSMVSTHNSDLPVVDCNNTGNVSGRIGDDTSSGKEIIVIRDGKQVKVRCK